MILYRPVGETELALIAKESYSSFPARLPGQPIFYPVLNEKYAAEIASKWNVNDIKSGNKGYITRFEIEDKYVSKFAIQTVGDSYHKELWVPAEELDEFNRHILGTIDVIATFT